MSKKSKSLDLTFARLANKHTEITKRNEKAKAYSAECKRRNKRKNNLYDAFIIGCLLLFSVGVWCICDAGAKARETETTEIVETTETTMENIITEEAVLVDINEDGEYIMQTPDGNQWSLIDPPEVYYELTFDNKGTDDRTDDVVIGLDELD